MDKDTLRRRALMPDNPYLRRDLTDVIRRLASLIPPRSTAGGRFPQTPLFDLCLALPRVGATDGPLSRMPLFESLGQALARRYRLPGPAGLSLANSVQSAVWRLPDNPAEADIDEAVRGILDTHREPYLAFEAWRRAVEAPVKWATEPADNLFEAAGLPEIEVLVKWVTDPLADLDDSPDGSPKFQIVWFMTGLASTRTGAAANLVRIESIGDFGAFTEAEWERWFRGVRAQVRARHGVRRSPKNTPDNDERSLRILELHDFGGLSWQKAAERWAAEENEDLTPSVNGTVPADGWIRQAQDLADLLRPIDWDNPAAWLARLELELC